MTLTKFLHQQRGLQKILADHIGVTPGVVSLWVSGRRRIPAERCRVIYEWSDKKVRLVDLRPDVFGKGK